MAVIIKDMELPNSCRNCKLLEVISDSGHGYNITDYKCTLDCIPFDDYAYKGGSFEFKGRHKNCLLTEV